MSRPTLAATALSALLLTACGSVLPWSKSPDAEPNEANLSVVVENNLLFLPAAKIDGKEGRYFFGSASPRTVIDRRYVDQLGGPIPTRHFQFGQRQSVAFTPLMLDLAPAGDAMIGADVFAGHSVTIDYRAGLVTFQQEGIYPAYMTTFNYRGPEPAITATVDGRTVTAVIDTSSPDTLTLPGQSGRGSARVVIAGTDFGSVDVNHAQVARPRIGNRLLSKFLVSIDYKRRIVGLWRDPRNP